MDRLSIEKVITLLISFKQVSVANALFKQTRCLNKPFQTSAWQQ